jgi:hypothetical protein
MQSQTDSIQITAEKRFDFHSRLCYISIRFQKLHAALACPIFNVNCNCSGDLPDAL